MTTETALERQDVLFDAKDYKSGTKPVWCPGCGDFGVLSATYKALTTLQLKPHEVVIVSGIGCSSRIPYFMSTFGVPGVHGPLPHAAARNPDITVVMMDNQTYGLTKAQASPTSVTGHVSKSTPYGAVAKPLNPVLLALSYGASFVARGYSAKANELSNLLVEAIQHPGFAFIHVQSPCTEFYNTYNLYDDVVEDIPAGHDTSNLRAAMD